ncbi:MAG: Maf-like protein [Planctomycetota bacterium]|nr:MAG: Maf-like protein [Planctomycetota bacterium]
MPQRQRQLVLASSSPYRRALMDRLGLRYDAVAPRGVDEEVAARSELPPEQLAAELARRKAKSLAAIFPDAVIIGCDQLCVLDDPNGGAPLVLGKPGTFEHALEQLCMLRGREHRLLTAVAVHDAASGRTVEALDEHRICLREVSEAALRAYLERERPLDCAGSYKIEGLGIALMEYVRGEDYTAVIGMPLTALVALLSEVGIEVLGADP